MKYSMCNGYYQLYFSVIREIIMCKAGTTISKALIEGQINKDAEQNFKN
jgi:hypothetical protein